MSPQKQIMMMISKMTLGEIADMILDLHLEVRHFEAKCEAAEKLAGDRAILAFELAQTSDRMKFELIMCGALRGPRDKDSPEDKDPTP